MSKIYITADKLTPDEGETTEWEIMQWPEERARKKVDNWVRGNLGELRVYEFDEGNIREVDKHDFDKYLIKVK